jgi:hypothetical protein
VARSGTAGAAPVFAHVASVAMAFLWLEFSQSFQVLAILASTLAHAVAFGFRPARAARLQPRHGHVLPFLSRLLVLMGNKEAVYIDDEQIQHQQVTVRI